MGLLVPNLRQDLDALRVDVALAALRDVVKDGWSVLGLSTGMVDALTDQTGIASLGGATYDGAAKTVGNPGVPSLLVPLGAVFGDRNNLAAAFDGNLSKSYTACAGSNNSAGPGYVGKAFGAATPVNQVVVTSSNDQGFINAAGTTTLTVYGKASAPASYNDGVMLGTTGGFADGPGATKTKTIAFSAVSYAYVWVVVQTSTGGGNWIGQVQYYGPGVAPAVTVVSSAFALGFQPSQARVIAPMEVGAGIIGTNGLFDVSRDGSAWAAVPLSDLGKFDASTRIVGGLVNLADQPAGSSIYWRWRTSAGIAQALHGVWVQCK